MGTRTTRLQLRKPAGGDSPDVPRDLGYLVDDLEAQLIRPPSATILSPGPSVETDFRNQALDEALFDFANTTRQNDPGGRPSIRGTQAPASTVWTMLSKAMFGPNVSIFLRYRPANDAATSTTDYAPKIVWNYIDDNNKFELSQYHNVGNPNLAVDAKYATLSAGAGGINGAAAEISPLSTTTDVLIRVDKIEDLVRFKYWRSDQIEPDWMSTRRVRTANQTVDNPPYGKVGLVGQYTGAYVIEFSCTELQKVDDNMLWNPGLDQFRDINNSDLLWNGANDNLPAFWYKSGAYAANVAYSEEVILDPLGHPRKALKLVKNATGASLWSQEIYNALEPGRSAFDASRLRRQPHVPFPAHGWCELEFLAKGDAITNVGGTLGAAWVMYTYDRTATVLQVGEVRDDDPNTLTPGTYTYGTIGPAGDGTGTFDWYRVRRRFQIPKPRAAQRLRFQFGFHDDTNRGTLWLLNPVLRPAV